jgi:hypothetical protein
VPVEGPPQHQLLPEAYGLVAAVKRKGSRPSDPGRSAGQPLKGGKGAREGGGKRPEEAG